MNLMQGFFKAFNLYIRPFKGASTTTFQAFCDYVYLVVDVGPLVIDLLPNPILLYNI